MASIKMISEGEVTDRVKEIYEDITVHPRSERMDVDENRVADADGRQSERYALVHSDYGAVKHKELAK